MLLEHASISAKMFQGSEWGGGASGLKALQFQIFGVFVVVFVVGLDHTVFIHASIGALSPRLPSPTGTYRSPLPGLLTCLDHNDFGKNRTTLRDAPLGPKVH